MANFDLYAPFDAGPGANVTEDTWRLFMRHMLGSVSGVILGFQNNMEVYADATGMNVKVRTGECWMRGHYGSNSAEKTLAIAAAHATLARIDRVVIRANFLTNVIGVEVLTGTPNASPVAPSVTQNASVWETSLAYVSVPAADTSIAANQVADDRVYTTAYAKYIRAGTQSIASSTFTKVSFTSISALSGDINQNPAATDFTLNRAGLWSVTGRGMWAPNGTGGRQLELIDSDNANAKYSVTTTAGVAAINLHQTLTAVERFPAGRKISLYAWQASGGALNIDNCDLTFTWIGP